MSENRERILKLQEKMQELNIDMYLVPTADFHQSEYVGDYFKARKWLSGFSGSAGTLLVTDDQAYLWTDGRYFIQAAKELEDTGVTLMKMREPGVPTVHEFSGNEPGKRFLPCLRRKSHQRVTGKSIQKNDGRQRRTVLLSGRLIRRHLE